MDEALYQDVWFTAWGIFIIIIVQLLFLTVRGVYFNPVTVAVN